MASILPLRSNKLAFPGGRPGINQAHPASVNLRVSSFNVGNNFISILNGAPFTIGGTGTVTSSIDNNIGPSAKGTKSLRLLTSFNMVPAAYTIAAIIRFSNSQDSMVVGTGDGGGSGFYINPSGNFHGFGLGMPASSFALTHNVPYLVVLSEVVGNGTPLNYLAVNLVTGQVLTNATVTTTTASIYYNDVYFVADAFGDTSSCLIAAGMVSGTFLPMPQLLAWASDPWSFWYPPQIDLSAIALKPSATIPPTPKAGTLSLMGVG